MIIKIIYSLLTLIFFILFGGGLLSQILNPELFKNKLEQENAQEQFAFNKKIIDFNEIPQNLQQEFLESYGF